MVSANKLLDRDRAIGQLGRRNIENLSDSSADGKGYIEMNLGLGVLEEKKGGGSEDLSDGTSDASSIKQSVKLAKKDPIQKLLNKYDKKAGKAIEEVA